MELTMCVYVCVWKNCQQMIIFPSPDKSHYLMVFHFWMWNKEHHTNLTFELQLKLKNKYDEIRSTWFSCVFLLLPKDRWKKTITYNSPPLSQPLQLTLIRRRRQRKTNFVEFIFRNSVAELEGDINEAIRKQNSGKTVLP